MPTLTLKISSVEARRLNHDAKLRGQTKSAYVRSLLADRIQTTDDLLRAWEHGEVPGVALQAAPPPCCCLTRVT
jgi:predicted DNA-binding protein